MSAMRGALRSGFLDPGAAPAFGGHPLAGEQHTRGGADAAYSWQLEQTCPGAYFGYFALLTFDASAT